MAECIWSILNEAFRTAIKFMMCTNFSSSCRNTATCSLTPGKHLYCDKIDAERWKYAKPLLDRHGCGSERAVYQWEDQWLLQSVCWSIVGHDSEPQFDWVNETCSKKSFKCSVRVNRTIKVSVHLPFLYPSTLIHTWMLIMQTNLSGLLNVINLDTLSLTNNYKVLIVERLIVCRILLCDPIQLMSHCSSNYQ